ncbi:MAG: hypothetical protein U1E52_21385 [Geminicoccaceae bacterium]
MPNEHLEKPKSPEDWRLYHAASKAALEEGEAAERWRSERRGGLDVYASLARNAGSSSSSNQGTFDGWRREARSVSAETYRLADSEQASFSRIAAAEAKIRLPVVKDGALTTLCNDIAVRPPSLDESFLAPRRSVARGPLEIMLDSLLQHGIKPDAPGFQQVLGDARLRVARDAGDLSAVLEAFVNATQLAVATKLKEPIPSPSWASDDGYRYFRESGDKLLEALRAWDGMVHSWDNPPRDEVLAKGKACSDALKAMAMGCAPSSALTDGVAFSAVTGLALLMALGERISAQIQSRFGEVTIQGLYNRILEIPDRAPPSNVSAVAQRGKAGFQKLAKFWRDEIDGVKKAMRKAGVDDASYKAFFDPNIQDPIKNALSKFDETMNDPYNLDTPAGLDALKKSVSLLAIDLHDLRKRAVAAAGLVGPAVSGTLEFPVARENMLDTIDTVARQMQVRLGLALNVGL